MIPPDDLDALIHEAADWLRIPSISTGEGDPAQLERAALWVTERIRGAGNLPARRSTRPS